MCCFRHLQNGVFTCNFSWITWIFDYVICPLYAHVMCEIFSSYPYGLNILREGISDVEPDLLISWQIYCGLKPFLKLNVCLDKNILRLKFH